MTVIASILGIVCIVGLSFYGLAPQFDPHLNSDQTVHILMAYDLQLPGDLYYWGQDRLGSLLPVLSHIALKLFPIAPVKMVGWINYGLVAIAYFCFASFFKRPLSWVLLASALFLPLQLYREILSTGQPYAAQFACLGLATVGLRWLLGYWSQAKLWQRCLGLWFTGLSIFASVWVSDFSVIYWAVVLGAIAHHLFFQLSLSECRRRYPWHLADTITLVGIIITGSSFLRLAKATAARSARYTEFNSLANIIDLLVRMGHSLIKNLRLEGQSFWMGIAAYWLVAIGICVIYVTWRYHHTLLKQPSCLWLGSWGLAAGCSMGILLLANWIYQPDHLPQRYFIVVYVLCWVATLLLSEQLPPASSRVLSLLLVGLAIASAMTLSHRILARDTPPRVVALQELAPLAPAGFIGDYWHSYVLCGANPELFHCTPYDRRGEVGCPKGNGKPYRRKIPVGSVVRCERCVENVLSSPTIYLVKQKWLEKFPKRIEQFGYCLEQEGKPFQIAQHKIAAYRKLDEES
ncbi:MAG: hypothetical protein F6K09_04350 [Merismopedia sp. SIO2A8]|nr:hypothetical protein [Merismopedia sp. SIO2A8]